jgi:chitodextrinase
MNRFITAVLLVFCSVSFAQNVNSFWKSSSRNSDSKSINKPDLPLKHLFDLDLHSLKNKLASSPKRNASNIASNIVISLPNGDGNLENFYVYENAVLAPELAAKYPEIKSYVAIGVDNPLARAYFSSSPLGFKSMTLYPDQSAVFIEPVTSDLNTYTIYKKSDKKDSLNQFECSVIDNAIGNGQKKGVNRILAKGADDGKLRTFRLALSCTAEYAQFFGGTKALTLAGMNNTLTRIDGVFEKDFGVQLILIANNDSVIFTDPLTDPYSDSTSRTNWKTEVQSTLTSLIGEANYDIGHLFGTSTVNCGDAGCKGCVCTDNYKGGGYTCATSTNFSGDIFDTEFVAHEMGHQLGASHTFTYKDDNNISQMEPGSGSTIMSYAGATTKDVQNFSDAYFHAISIQQVTDNIKTKTCSVLVSTGNAVPVVNAGADYTIPKGTPFLLSGSATDANTDDVLTYAWEEMDLGNATTALPNVSATTGPLFRSYPPSTSAVRYFPNMTTVLAGSVTTSGTEIPVEVLPGVARTLNFRLTVRDNRVGGSANNTDDMTITVDGNSGPFTVDSQNSAVSYKAGTTQTINWTVAGTNANGVNCSTVDILLSTDGGKTFPVILLSGTPNIGSVNVAIPNIPGTANRIMVKGTNQIFFDVNNVNFTISGSGTADTTAPTTSILSASGTTTSGTTLSWTAATDNVGLAGYNIYQNGTLKTTTTATSLAVSGLSASTAYSFYVVAKDISGNISVASNTVNATTLYLDTIAPTAATLSASGTTTSSTDLSWTAATDNIGVAGYNVYQNNTLIATTTANSLIVPNLSAATAYSFYVVTKDTAGNLSAASNTVNAITLSTSDTSAPSTSTLSALGTTTSGTDLSWNAATDNIGVTGYKVYQNGVLKTTTTSTSLAISGLSASTTYNFYVLATDAAGNMSAASNTATVTTLSASDTTAPTAVTLSASGITTSSTDLSWTVATDNIGVTGYNIYQNSTLISTTTANSLTVSNLSAATAYNFYVVAKDASGNLSVASNTVNPITLSDTGSSTLANATIAYCSSYGTSTAREYINKVQIGSINSTSGNNNGYGNFTSISTDLALGSTNTIVITPAWNGSYSYEAFSVWIDFNQDGDFNDSGELVYSKSKTKSKFKSVSGYLAIPTTALTGSTRMRISMKNSTLPNPCEIFAYGEVEDYTVNIIGSTARPGDTEIIAINGTANTLEVTKLSLKLYPNPVKGDVLNISNLEEPSDFRIFNLMGQELGSNHIENDAVYVGALKTGVYFIEITDGVSTTTKQFIKE